MENTFTNPKIQSSIPSQKLNNPKKGKEGNIMLTDNTEPKSTTFSFNHSTTSVAPDNQVCFMADTLNKPNPQVQSVSFTTDQLAFLMNNANHSSIPIFPFLSPYNAQNAELLAQIQHLNDHIKSLAEKLTSSASNVQSSEKKSQIDKKNKFKPEERLNIAIEAVNEGNNSKVARAHGISEAAVRKCVKDFKDDQTVLSVLNRKRKLIQSSSKGSKFPEMEQKLIEYIVEQRTKKLAVRKLDIIAKALEFHKTCYPSAQEHFSASNGWFHRFVKRANLSHRTPTHVLQQLKVNIEDEILEFWKKIIRLRTSVESIREMGDQKQTLFLNIDEVPIQLDLSPRKTYHIKGSKMVEIKQSYGTKIMCTAILGILSSGYKLPIYLITKSSTPIDVPEELKPYLIIKNNESGWNNVDLFKDWLKRILFNFKMPSDTRLVFILDQAKMHTAQSIISLLNEHKDMSYFFIPSGCTFLLQPLDVSVNKPLKDRLRQRFKDWFSEFGHKKENQTPSGYFRPPKYQTLGQWLVEEWDKLPMKIVEKAFKVCGLTLKIDHSEDHLINPRIKDHVFLEEKLYKHLIDTSIPHDDRENFLEKVKGLNEITYEICEEKKTKEDEESSEGSIIDLAEAFEDHNPIDDSEVSEFSGSSKVHILQTKTEIVVMKKPSELKKIDNCEQKPPEVSMILEPHSGIILRNLI